MYLLLPALSLHQYTYVCVLRIMHMHFSTRMPVLHMRRGDDYPIQIYYYYYSYMQCKTVFTRSSTAKGEVHNSVPFASHGVPSMHPSHPCLSFILLLLEQRETARKSVCGATPVLLHHIAIVLHPIQTHTHTLLFKYCRAVKVHGGWSGLRLNSRRPDRPCM